MALAVKNWLDELSTDLKTTSDHFIKPRFVVSLTQISEMRQRCCSSIAIFCTDVKKVGKHTEFEVVVLKRDERNVRVLISAHEPDSGEPFVAE